MNVDALLEIEPLVDIKVIKETLSRCGVANKKTKVLYPSCYIFEQDGRCFLAHFKELFLLTRDNSYNNLSEDDIVRRNSIAFCLRNWELINVDDEAIEKHDKFIFVLNHKDKKDWQVSHKFNIRSLESINTNI